MNPSRFDQLTQRLALRTSRRAALGASLASLALASTGRAFAQESTPEPLPPGVGTPQPGEEPVFMFVQTALLGRGEINPAAGTPVVEGQPVAGGGASYLVTLEGHSGQTIFFSDRPDRIVGAVPTETFLETLGFSPVNPPNAALVGEFAAGDGVVVLELINPLYDAENNMLTYGAELLQGYAGEGLLPVTRDQVEAKLPAEFAHASLFIDDCPDLDECWRDGFIQKYIGPVPGGPYGSCWQGLLDGCEPCWYSMDYLESLCNDAYSDCDGRCIVGA